MLCPVIAGDGVINGLRGESRRCWVKVEICSKKYLTGNLVRRIEDKLSQLQMEAKLVQVMFDTSSLQGNRNLARVWYCCIFF